MNWGDKMSKKPMQKSKLLYLRKILYENTDENNPMTINEIISSLQSVGISAERKSIYSDLEALCLFGDDIISIKSKNVGYYVGNRPFELAELKLMVDVVQSSKFITYKKSDQLIKKIENMASISDAGLLQRHVHVFGRVKTMNESIYYNVDEIHNAINHNAKIKFHYFEWNLKKQRAIRKNGEFYTVSPWALTWDDENYYMIAYDDKSEIIKHYRVDKMMDISLMDELRKGESLFADFDIASYSRKTFGMYGGNEKNVTLSFPNSLVGVVIDRFGTDINILPIDDENFSTSVKIAVSPQFFSWVFSLKGSRILSPDDVVCEYSLMLKNSLKIAKNPES